MGTCSLVRPLYANIGVIFSQCTQTLRPYVLLTIGGNRTICRAQREGSRAMVSRQYDLLSRLFLPLGGFFNVTLPAKGPPSAMIFSSLLLFKKLWR
mmetsp:Transcript_100894/g.162771  ORF Transcript_100894/g.162771 Transcript_100894/m.162771 type:complete len:96 (+) Transcript_100894:2741-3028(+)